MASDNALTKSDLKWLANFLDEHKQYESDDDTIAFYEALIGKLGFAYDVSSEDLLQSIADALWGDGDDTTWCADTLDAIADAIDTIRPDLKAARL